VRRRLLAVVVALAAAVVTAHAAQEARVLPPDSAALTAALAATGIRDTPLASCRGEVRVGHPSEFVVAVGTPTGGRYLLLQDDGRTAEVSTYEGQPDLRCYSVRQADALTAEIAKSDTMHGRITAEWDGLVVCGAIDPTIVVCWQHAVERKGFARIGGWMH
jgi:hypothetical protein